MKKELSEFEVIKNFNELNSDFFIKKEDDRILIVSLKNKKWLPFYMDFSSNEIIRRKEWAEGNQEIARAVGVKKNYKPYILDTTAGLGRDSFILASLGCKIKMLERNSTIFLLLQNAINLAQKNDKIRDIIQNMKLVNLNSIEYLKNNKEIFDVIYIDPMFPKSKKSRLVKKDMQIFREIVGNDLDSGELLKISLLQKVKRVVVKRMLKSEYINGLKPNFEIKGTTTRFDVYTQYI